MQTLQEFLDKFKATRRQTLKATPAEARALLHQLFYTPLAQREKVAKILDEKISGPHGTIPIRLYIPKGKAPHPVLMFFHWGGWVYGSVEESDHLCRKLCNRTDAIIASVDYRLAPENPFPSPFDDCYTATTWVAKHAQEFLGDHKHIGVMGESAGGNLAAAVATKAQTETLFRLSLQVLINPILDYNCNTIGQREEGEDLFMTKESIRWFWKQYLPEGKEGYNPLIAPLEAASLQGIPETIIVTAGRDSLRSEALAYAKRLRDNHRPVVVLDYPAAVHGFLSLPVDLPEAEKALQELTKDIKILIGSCR